MFSYLYNQPAKSRVSKFSDIYIRSLSQKPSPKNSIIQNVNRRMNAIFRGYIRFTSRSGAGLGAITAVVAFVDYSQDKKKFTIYYLPCAVIVGVAMGACLGPFIPLLIYQNQRDARH